jgi:hypothetical protein
VAAQPLDHVDGAVSVVEQRIRDPPRLTRDTPKVLTVRLRLVAMIRAVERLAGAPMPRYVVDP